MSLSWYIFDYQKNIWKYLGTFSVSINNWIFLRMGLVSIGNIFSGRCCTIALSWWIPSLMESFRFSTFSFASLVWFLFPYTEWSRCKCAQLLLIYKICQLRTFYNCWVFFLAEFDLAILLAISKFFMMTKWILNFQELMN